jgi:branched-chain amino acid transport system substrate-binding protein
MKKICLSTLLSVLMTVFLATPQNVAAKKPIKIGVLVPLSGFVAQSGIEMRDGMLMAAKEKGTILGRPIKLIIEDTRVKPDTAVSKAEKLVYKDDCIALIGVLSSAVGMAIYKNIDKLRVPFLITQAVSSKFYGLHKYVFRSGQIAADQSTIGNIAGILANPDLRNRTYYVLILDFAYGHDVAKIFIKHAKEKGVKVYSEKYDKAPLTTTDWSSYISKIKATGADGLFLALFTNTIPVFARQANEFGLKCKIISPGASGPQELQAGGEGTLGIFATADWCWDINTPESDAWEMKYWQMYKTIPSAAACHSYVGAMNLFNGIERAGSTDVDKIAKALKGISFDGPYGVVRISPKDNSGRQNAVFTETRLAPPNPFGAKVYMKVLSTFKAEELGPPE